MFENHIIASGATADFVSISIKEGSDVLNITFLRDQNVRKYTRALSALNAKDHKTLRGLAVQVHEALEEVDKRFEVKQGKVFFEGRELNNFAAKKITELYNASLPFDNWVNFLKNALANPHALTVEDLYRFLENHEGCPITEDGAVLVYKKVRHDFQSYFTGTDGKPVNWSPGQVVEMEREACDADRNRTCSSGLHVCSKSYLKHFYGDEGKVVLCKVFPQDFVAIPVDYNQAKARVCRATVLKEIDNLQDFAFGSYYTANGEAVDATAGFDEDAMEDLVELLDVYHDQTVSGDFRISGLDLYDELEEIAEEHGLSFLYDAETLFEMLRAVYDSDLEHPPFELDEDEDPFDRDSCWAVWYA